MDKNKKSAQLNAAQQKETKSVINALLQGKNVTNEPNRTGTLDDESRVKVLSPGMMVFKRFVRNRLAITGFIILVFMFSFSFLGGLFSPYRQDQVFYRNEYTLKDFAGATFNKEFRTVVKDGFKFPGSAYGSMILAYNNGKTQFDADGTLYSFTVTNDDFFRITEFETLSNVTARKRLYSYEHVGDFKMSDAMSQKFEEAHQAGDDTFEFDGKTYNITRDKLNVAITTAEEIALASPRVYDPYQKEDAPVIASYGFRFAFETAFANGEEKFTYNDNNYSIDKSDNLITVYLENGAEKQAFANISDMIVNAISPDVFVPVEFKNKVRQAALNKEKSFEYALPGEENIEYRIELVHETYNIKRQTETHLIDMYHAPDEKHLLGTDMNGMDVMTRLMYGGRISLLVGFVVVFIEMFIGVSIGGISGYFGGWVDTILMRFIDLFNSIPYWPIMIILGSVMDTMEIDPYTRVFMLMMVMGFMGWTGIARVVRGQILALREQDFMVAAEASGLSVRRRIVKHLVPNVMPLLIVQGTMALGGIILTEATLSFLGLGVKYPIASWGSIINAASQPFIVNNYWFIWIPAGILILLTVLGFNFVGDGLRDAYDPKMKR
ncbi:MAG: ABC transporter permease [Eubacteriales bacterium]|nr:ABC transporter permease [Eubacteriales bacterium]